MAGLYVHIPFCRSKCHYCNFVSVASSRHKSEYVSAIIEEIRQQQAFFVPEDPVGTIYFGGGTPSQLSNQQIHDILNAVYKYLIVAPETEITFELNPEEGDSDYLQELKLAGINRLSIGVQSFHDGELNYLGRKHTARTAFNSVLTARNEGFQNISLDIIYGLPSSVTKDPEYNLKQLLVLNPEHISSYSLTLEEKTALYHFVAKKKIQPPDEETAAEQFKFYMKNLISAGYEHYEISNYAKPGYLSKHNSAYWENKKYLGIGAGAHSYNLQSRFRNTGYISEYIQGIMSENPASETEILSAGDKYNDYIITSIRTSRGADINAISMNFGKSYAAHFQNEISKFVENGFIVVSGSVFTLSDEGKLWADRIATDLMSIL